jgi:hypothetical protein
MSRRPPPTWTWFLAIILAGIALQLTLGGRSGVILIVGGLVVQGLRLRN